MSEAQQSHALKNLIVFIACLAILGVILALVLYVIGMVPVQQAVLSAPQNGQCFSCL